MTWKQQYFLYDEVNNRPSHYLYEMLCFSNIWRVFFCCKN